MLAVISPSKTQDFNPSDVTTFTQTRQMKQSQTLIDILKDKTQDEISSLMSISEKLSFQTLNICLLGYNLAIFFDYGTTMKKPLLHLPKAHGLYHPDNEKENCGVGFIAHIKGQGLTFIDNGCLH
jgi:hypothetical protein